MMKYLYLIVCAVAAFAVSALAVDDYTLQDVRNPRKLSARLTSDFASVVSTSDAARVTALEAAPNVTNAMAATVMTMQRGAQYSVTNIVKQTAIGYDATGAAVTNAAGESVAFLTNIVIQYAVILPVTNATAATTMTLQR